jgi:hypothetical protein
VTGLSGVGVGVATGVGTGGAVGVCVGGATTTDVGAGVAGNGAGVSSGTATVTGSGGAVGIGNAITGCDSAGGVGSPVTTSQGVSWNSIGVAVLRALVDGVAAGGVSAPAVCASVCPHTSSATRIINGTATAATAPIANATNSRRSNGGTS